VGGISAKEGPNTHSLEYVSPSDIVSLETCFLQTAFSKDSDFRNRAYRGPRARLGSACHRLLERVAKGEMSGVPETEWRPVLKELWDREVSEQERELRAAPLESHYGSAARWPGYAIRKAQTLVKAQEILLRRQRAVGRSGCFQAERWYDAYGGKLKGRADAVYSSEGRTEVADYKTGSIYEPAEGGELALKQVYKRQVLLYAAMHHWETGEWPTAAYIIPVEGERHRVTIDAAEAEREADHAIGLLDEYNDSVERLRSTQDLAKPSQEACRWCSYKAFCEPFRAQVSPEWEWSSNLSAEGTVLRSRAGTVGEWTIDMNVLRGNFGKGEYTIRGSRRITLEEGQALRIINLKAVGEQSAYTIMDYTELWDRSEDGVVSEIHSNESSAGA
jgi:RecB family exonuclease